MNPRQIDRFFHVLAQELPQSARVIVTGAAAGSLWGCVRPSVDIDFAIQLFRRGRKGWSQVDAAVDRAVTLTGISANYAEDIDRWGLISLLDYRRRTTLYRKFSNLEVRLLDPAYWSIGKITRYLDPDVQDLVAVLTRRRVPAAQLIRVWARALRASPPSTARSRFRQQAEHFLRTYGRTIWGKRFDSDRTVRQFHQQIRI